MHFYNIGLKIRELRKQRNMTQEQLAQKVGTSRQTISKLEQGRIHKISLQMFVKIIDIMDYELEISARKPVYFFDVNDL